MPPSPNPLFKFNRDGFSVHVGNVADAVTRREILDLFNNLIGDITKCDENYDAAGRRYYALTFASQDAAKKALCMSGYNIDGTPMAVTAVTAPSELPRPKPAGQPDDRQNLYVLGLPFDLTNAEFHQLFSRFGSVVHSVILATVDNASRRRGFIVMSQHHEAKRAMDALNRKEIKGHIIDVSWSVVQRSKGFLDGGDRATFLSNPSPSPSPTPFDVKDLNPVLPLQASIVVTPSTECPPMTTYSARSASLLIRNLPSVLFSQLSDLHPLLGPYGDVKKLEIAPSEAGESSQVAAMVEYATPFQAAEAAQALHGQVYSNEPIVVEFLAGQTNGTDGKPGLNPHAPPFVVQAGLGPNALLASVTPVYPGPGLSHDGLAALSEGGVLAVDPQSLSPYGAPLLYVPLAGVRPSSAPTTRRYERPCHLAFQSGHRFSMPPSPITRSSYVA